MNLLSSYTFQNAGLTSLNRVALAPMTNQQSHEDGTLSDDEYNWLERRAAGGFGMIITCAANVSKDGQGWPGELGIYDDLFISGLKRLADGIRSYKSLGIVQIFHGGARSPFDVTGSQPWSASEHIMQVGSKLIEVAEGTIDQIESTIDAFVASARRAHEAGFDGVELHGAHGYLLHQFLSSVTNKRTDKWGGNFDNRSRLIRTILQKIKTALPSNFIVGVRLSPEDKYTFQGIDFDESLGLAALLSEDGADYIHVSPWDALKKPEKYPDGDKALITYFRDVVPAKTAVIVAGEIWSREDGEKALSLGADIVALGKAGIGMPEWPKLITNPDFIPIKPPYSISHLQQAGLSPTFIDYMKRWKGFVEE